MKKVITLVLSLIILNTFFQDTALAISDENNLNYSNITEIANPSIEEIPLVTYCVSDGSIETSTYVYNPIEARNNTEMYLPAYFPEKYKNNYEHNVDNLKVSGNVEKLTGSSVYTQVGNLISYFDQNNDNIIDMSIDTDSYGSASLQGHDVLISCAHAVWAKYLSHYESQGWALQIVFYAGRTAQNTYIDSAYVTHMSISQSYVDNTTIVYDENGFAIGDNSYTQEDWSILRIDRSLMGTCGCLGLHGCGEPELGMNLKLVGYPYQMNGSSSIYQQWRSYGTMNAVDGNVMKYNAYNYYGFSGGPLVDDYGLVYGINTHVYNDIYGNPIWTSAGGTRMYPALFQMIADAREEAIERWEN